MQRRIKANRPACRRWAIHQGRPNGASGLSSSRALTLAQINERWGERHRLNFSTLTHGLFL